MFYNMKKDNKTDLSKSKCSDNWDFSEDRICGNLYNRTHQDSQFIKEKDKEKKISEEKYNDVQKDIEQQKADISQPKYNELLKNYQESITKIDDIILKKYISRLSELPIIPFENEIKDDIFNNEKEPNHEEVKDEKEKKTEKIFNLNNLNKIRIFKIDKMIYEKDEFALHKFATVFNVFSAIKTALFVIIDSDGVNTEFYMGIRCDSDDNEENTTTSIGDMLNSAMIGQFCGIEIKEKNLSEKNSILQKINEKDFNSISSVSCVSDTRDENLNENTKFVQGLEKLVISMQGKKYTGIILANTATQENLNILRNNYEQLYTQLSAFASKQLNYGFNFSIGESKSNTISVANNILNQLGITFTKGNTHSVSTSEKDPTSKTINVIASICGSGSLGRFLRGISDFFEKTTTIQDSSSESTALNMVNSYSKTIEESDTKENSLSQGMNNSITLDFKDKTIENILLRIEKQLKRIDEFESLGMFECAGYFLSEDRSTSKIVASTYKSIVCGKKSGIETSAVNTWYYYENKIDDYKQIIKYVKNFTHPVFKYSDDINIKVTPCSMVSGNELAILMGLPRKSVCGFPVIEHADFGKEVITYDLDSDSEESKKTDSQKIELGCIFNMGKEYEEIPVCLDKESLSMHTFVTGTTGSGKSNTIYELIAQVTTKIDQSNKEYVKFMVIEPAKGEYKNIFGNRNGVKIFGTDPRLPNNILRINPFKFPEKIHIFQHIDRLVEIFNVCWPMSAAMPAFLKKAILKSYKDKEWDFVESKNKSDFYSTTKDINKFYPKFSDVLKALEETINNSSYSDELKSNYIGSLVTRVESLTNGINEKIFTSDEIDNKDLFDNNVIVDLSDIPSLETKSLIMGILIMRLSEYRMANFEGMNRHLKHITVLEEAHNILKRTSKEQNPEYPSILGKSVEMISNAIAEMRTYGEGFIIVDQSPNEVDLSAIRNTNTKIIMRLPDEMDRRLAGKSAGLKEEQLDEIVKLPKGVAVVYQNDWVEPVLCKIKKYGGNT